MSMPRGEVVDPPHSLKSTDECSLDQVVDCPAPNLIIFIIMTFHFSCYRLVLQC
jgi:hypothetical protein